MGTISLTASEKYLKRTLNIRFLNFRLAQSISEAHLFHSTIYLRKILNALKNLRFVKTRHTNLKFPFPDIFFTLTLPPVNRNRAAGMTGLKTKENGTDQQNRIARKRWERQGTEGRR